MDKWKNDWLMRRGAEFDVIPQAAEVELCPQGTLAERLRAAGAVFLPSTRQQGWVLCVRKGGKRENLTVENISLNALHGDFEQQLRGDTNGNLIFNKTARNFNPLIARAAKLPSQR